MPVSLKRVRQKLTAYHEPKLLRINLNAHLVASQVMLDSACSFSDECGLLLTRVAQRTAETAPEEVYFLLPYAGVVTCKQFTGQGSCFEM